MGDGIPTDVDDPEGLPVVTYEEILAADSVERFPEQRIVVVDGEARFDPDSELATDGSE